MFPSTLDARAFVAVAMLASAFPAVSAVPVTGGSEAPVPSLAPMIKRVSPAVVNIATRGTIRERSPQNPLLEDPFFRRFFDIPEMGPRERQFQSAGSGVIFDAKNGYIVTNAHVVDNATEITVTLQDGRDLTATVVGSDVPSDVAVLKVPTENLIQIPLGDSAKLEQGDYVVAIGNPFGLQHSATFGMVSGVGRSGINPEGYEDFIQTDASINPGNSGGALVNLRGELVGINSAILSRSGGNIGIGFAIPVNMARSIMDQLIKYGSVKRGLLGVNIVTLTPDTAKALGLSENTQGVLVSQVTDESAAAKAGIKPGDVITNINGQNIKSNAELRNAVGLSRIGEKLDVALIRDRKPLHVTAVIVELPQAAATSSKKGTPGSADTGPIHPGLEGATLADAPDGGVMIRAIEARSAASQLFRIGDRIEGANRQTIANLKELREVASRGGAMVLKIRRGNTVVLVPLRAP